MDKNGKISADEGATGKPEKAKKGNWSFPAKTFLVLGIIFIACAVLLLALNIFDSERARSSAAYAVSELEQKIQVSHDDIQDESQDDAYDPVVSSETEGTDAELSAVSINGSDYMGILAIPSLNLELPVLKDWSYEGLRISPTRYTGSASTRDLVICAHNYDSHFGRLKYLVPGDEITFTDLNGNVYEYEVVISETLEPTDVADMIDSSYDLSLFTCTIGGKARVTVRCMLTDS
ncbi:MAG: sortase [Eggerthellaceae bacterium]|nr:sortase [Eggerthellaceae bacterium]